LTSCHIHIGCVRLEWISLRILWPFALSMKPYLPLRVFSQIERAIRSSGPTGEQLDEISRLGRSIGLQRNEIIAAIDAPLAEPGITGKSRFSLYISIIVITIVVAFSILIIWSIVDPETSPIHTYAPGTFYGTIRPQDFSNRRLTVLTT
jgi:hypothetical protein